MALSSSRLNILVRKNLRSLWGQNLPKILSHYIGVRVMHASALVLVALIALELLGKLLQQIGRKSPSSIEATAHALSMDIWLNLVEYLPYAFLLGALWVFGDMARNREFLATQSAGLEPRQILHMALRLPLLCSCLVLGAQEYVPSWMRYWGMTFGSNDVFLRRDIWYKNAQDYWLLSGVNNAGTRVAQAQRYRYDADHILKNIIDYEQGLSYNQQTATWHASVWTEKIIGVRRALIKSYSATEHESIDSNTQFKIEPKVLRALMTPQDYLSPSGHWVLASRPELNPELASRHKFIFWYALVMPFVTITFILLAFAMTIYHRTRVDSLLTVFVGAILGMCFAFGNNLIFVAGLQLQWWAWLCAFLPVILILAGVLLLFKNHVLLQRLVYNLQSDSP